MDVYHRSTLMASALRSRLVPKVNDSVNFSRDKLHAFKRNTAGYVGLVVAVVFPSFLCNKPSELSNEGMIDEADLTRRWKGLEKRESYECTVLLVKDSAYKLWLVGSLHVQLSSSLIHPP